MADGPPTDTAIRAAARHGLAWPTEDRELSPYTGWTRDHLATFADAVLLGVRPYASTDHARIRLPGRPSAHGPDTDDLEAFARSFELAAMRLAGSDDDPYGFADWYAAGLRAGTDPHSPTAWPRSDVDAQSRVEACSIALGLHLSRRWLWDRLPDHDQQLIVDWLSTVVGLRFPTNNWVWFQLVVEAFLASVGADWSADDVAHDLAVHEGLYRDAGWYSDGAERSFDHYVGWVLQFHPILWAEFAPPAMCPPELRSRFHDRLQTFTADAALLVGGDGAPLIQGRSLIYRYAVAGPFWLAAEVGATDLSPGLVRRIGAGMVQHFAGHGVPDERGLLTLGLRHEWPAMAQTYSAPGSPYWSSRGLYGLALPADHPVWTAVEQPLPVEKHDQLNALPVPGWLVSSTARDGIVRVINHGTDHSTLGDDRSDAPMYARLGYSTATAPTVTGTTQTSPLDGAIALVDPDGRRTHRNGFAAVCCEVVDGVGVAVSRAHGHWVDVPVRRDQDPGRGRVGELTPGPELIMASVVRGPVEVRLATVLGDPGPAQLEMSGWAVASPDPVDSVTEPGTARVHGPVTSTMHDLGGLPMSRIQGEVDSSPLGHHVGVPALRSAGPAVPGRCHAAAVVLTGAEVDPPGLPTVEVDGDGEAVITWPDGRRTNLRLS
ncbi:DUF2264 domain-containing protein [Microlunatus sp. Y2014]|uniref:DUF2264 domain-containing protein n=1 Tax=Microlunatus sp. Y2014 TaxID=3418488 RepID=UPI003DA6D697